MVDGEGNCEAGSVKCDSCHCSEGATTAVCGLVEPATGTGAR